MSELKSIADEAEDCRAAWAAMPGATRGLHIHHGEPVDVLRQPITNRIAYILDEKPKAEQALRLRLMRPLTAPALKIYEEARAQAHAAICVADCPWDGRTIFPNKEAK